MTLHGCIANHYVMCVMLLGKPTSAVRVLQLLAFLHELLDQHRTAAQATLFLP